MVNQNYADIIDRKLTMRIDPSEKTSDSDLKKTISECISELARRTVLTESEKKELLESVFNARRKLGILQPLLDNPDINEIMINGTDSIYVERNGKLERLEERFSDYNALFNTIQSMVSWINRSVNESCPIVDARLSDGSRVNIVLKPVAINGPAVTIRKFSDRIFTAEDFVKNGTITLAEADFLEKCVLAKANIFVSGGTSSGKTTFLNMLCRMIPADERIVTVEDSAELRLMQPNIVKLETKNSNSEGKGEIPMRQLIKASLRMRPDRVIVGEVRDQSALEMLQAMNTGHDGSMSTAHANSAEDVITRIETMALWEGSINAESVRKQIASGIDVVVHMQRDSDMNRRVAEIAAVCGMKDGQVRLESLFKNGTQACDMETVEKEGGGKLCEKFRQAGSVL